jgi:hypothetical protein
MRGAEIVKTTQINQKVVAEHGVVCSLPNDYFGYFGWPTVTRMDDGTLVATASGFRHAHVCPYGRSVISMSYDEGLTWTHPRVINDSPLDDRDTGVISLGGKKLMINWFSSTFYHDYTQQPEFIRYPYDWDKQFEWSWIRISDDSGITWGKPKKVDVFAPHGPARLRNGDLIYLGNDAAGMARGGPAKLPARAIKSIDNGETWTNLGSVPWLGGPKEIDCHGEPHLIELPDGRLLAMFRMQAGVEGKAFDEMGLINLSLMQAYSEDGGLTWSVPEPLDLRGYPPHLLQHSTGAIVCVYGYRDKPYGQHAMISYDNGESWTCDYILRDDGFDWDLGYPSSVELPDGTIFTLYYQHNNSEDEMCSLFWTKWRLPEKMTNE